MGKRISSEAEGRIRNAAFTDFSEEEEEKFVKAGMERYLPQFSGWPEQEISVFAAYQKEVWLNGIAPEIGLPLFSLNPTFLGDVTKIRTHSRNHSIYTRASEKENGYRFQVHIGPRGAHAFTRQFTRYDLRLMPELEEILSKLPVMIGDAELVNEKFIHLAAFNRLQKRIPNANYWPRREEEEIDNHLLQEMLSDQKMFDDSFPKDDYRLTLSFHGLFAISAPELWCCSKEQQLESLRSVCSLPVNFRMVDVYLDDLAEYLEGEGIRARVVPRKTFSSKKRLKNYVQRQIDRGLEGAVVVQSSFMKTEDEFGELSEDISGMYKFKKYETIDTALLGIYLFDPERGIRKSNLKGALLGLYDDSLQCYLPVCKVNLDTNGIQIKEEHQRERLLELNGDLEALLRDCEDQADSLVTLYDAYLEEAKIKVSQYLEGIDQAEMSLLFECVPRGKNLHDLYEVYTINKELFDEGIIGNRKSDTKTDRCIHQCRELFSEIHGLQHKNKRRYDELLDYLAMASEIKKVSAKLQKPHFLCDPRTNLIILETKVFDIKWKLNPYAAGFHSYYANSFFFSNCYAECVRHDKGTTTDYVTVREIANTNTVK